MFPAGDSAYRVSFLRLRSGLKVRVVEGGDPGAEPVLFLDCVSVGRLDPDRIAQLVEGVADGCRQAGCALLEARNVCMSARTNAI